MHYNYGIMKSSLLLHIQELERSITNENVGPMAIHIEYLARTEFPFSTPGKWLGLKALGLWTSGRHPDRRVGYIQDCLLIMRTELRKRAGIRNYHDARRRMRNLEGDKGHVS